MLYFEYFVVELFDFVSTLLILYRLNLYHNQFSFSYPMKLFFLAFIITNLLVNCDIKNIKRH